MIRVLDMIGRFIEDNVLGIWAGAAFGATLTYLFIGG